MKIYMDVCCLCRPFDDSREDRVRMEAEAVKTILLKIKNGDWSGITSSIIDYELSLNPDIVKRAEVMVLASSMDYNIVPDESVRDRGRQLEKLGCKGFDALHIACAEKARADVFLTTDDGILRRVSRLGKLSVAVDNPLRWLERVLIR